MTFSALTTRLVGTPNKSTRGSVKPTFIVLHHMATTSFEGVLRSWATGTKQGSAHYAISNSGEVVGVVPEEYRAWSLSSATFDAKSITFEIANQSTGGNWPVSAAAAEATAQVVADIARRHGIPLNRDRVIGHREVFTRFGSSYATACPGGLDMDRIVARARAINAVAAVAAINLTTIPAAAEEEDDMGFYITTGSAAAKFWFSQSTGTKRSIGRDEWSVLRASGQPLNIVTVTAANLALIPGR